MGFNSGFKGLMLFGEEEDRSLHCHNHVIIQIQSMGGEPPRDFYITTDNVLKNGIKWVNP